ncbi:hypothetical protein CP8484711_0918B, partial [Chlamydia psittaci 84-8471/1]
AIQLAVCYQVRDVSGEVDHASGLLSIE